MDKITVKIPSTSTDIQDTSTLFWQFKTKKNLNEEDLRQIKENLIGFFTLLNEWKENKKLS